MEQNNLSKLPPHSLSAEQAVLAALLTDPEISYKVFDILNAEHFYHPQHKLIFKAISKLSNDKQPVDVLTVSSELERYGLEKLSEYTDLLHELSQNALDSSHVASYSTIVYNYSLRRQMVSVGNELVGKAFDLDGAEIKDVLDTSQAKLLQMVNAGNTSTKPESILPIVSRTISLIEERSKQDNALIGMATGFTDFDKMISGLQPGELVIIAGRPSMGKTTLSINMAENIATRLNKTVLIFSLEMSSEQLLMKMFSSLGGVDLGRIQSGKIKDLDWQRVEHAISAIKNNGNIIIDETAGLSPMEINARTRRVVQEYGKIDMVVIDYLQLIRGNTTNSESRTQEVAEISRSLKGLAKELKIPVVVASQLNRSLEQRVNKRPILSDLRESGAIEQDADLIVFIYRDEYYNSESQDKGVAEIIIGKQRTGPTGTIKLLWEGHLSRFRNLAIHED